jgi:hypothetical protein
MGGAAARRVLMLLTLPKGNYSIKKYNELFNNTSKYKKFITKNKQKEVNM